MAYIPLATFIFVLGVKWLAEVKNKKISRVLVIFIFILIGINYFDFAKYYWYTYPKLISQDFSPNFNVAMARFRKVSQESGKVLFLERTTYLSHKADIQFFKEIYFPFVEVKIWEREAESFPKDAIVLTTIGGDGENLVNFGEIPSVETGQKTVYIVGERK